MGRWPRDNQNELIAFYGDPGTGAVAKQLVPLVPPFRMTYDGKPVKHIMVHKKTYDAFKDAFDLIWDYYGQDQNVLDELRISHTAGTYAPRKVRGSKTKWSNHAFGGAIDLDAEHNGFNSKGTIPFPVIAAFKAQGMRWGGDYKSRKDPMHFECCSSGEHERTFEEWLEYYNQPSQYMAPMTAMDIGNMGVAIDDNPGVEINKQTGDTDFTVPDTEPDSDTPDITDHIRTGKSLLKSKTSWIMNGLGLSGGSAIINSDPNLQNSLMQLLSNPRFLWLVIIIGVVIAGLVFYYRDHGKGARQ